MRYLLLLIAMLSVGATFGDIRSAEIVSTVEGSPATGECAAFDANDNIIGVVCGSGTGDLLADGTIPLTADWDVGLFDITAVEFKGALIGNASTVTNGVYTTDFPLNQDTTGLAGTATALAANGANCSAGDSPLGVDASGAVEGCFTVLTAEVDGSIGNEFNTVAGDDNVATTGLAISIDGAGTVTTDVVGDVLTVTGSAHTTAEGTLAGRSLTLNTLTVDADSELYTGQAGRIAFENPVATDDFFFNEINIAQTAVSIYCKTLVGTVNLDVQIAGVDINGSDIVCTTSGVLDSSLAGDTDLNVGEELKLAITSVATAPTYLMVVVNSTKDD